MPNAYENSLALERFLYESNRIDDIYQVTPDEIATGLKFLASEPPDIALLQQYVRAARGNAELREWAHMASADRHNYPDSGPMIHRAVSLILEKARNNAAGAFELHREFMRLSPFESGNGQAGRLLWLYQVRRHYGGMRASFLHGFYTQALANGE